MNTEVQTQTINSLIASATLNIAQIVDGEHEYETPEAKSDDLKNWSSYLSELEQAKTKIKEGTFGYCVCGKKLTVEELKKSFVGYCNLCG